MAKIVIVNAGGWGCLDAENKDYDNWIEMMKEILEKVAREKRKTVDIKIISTTDEIEKMMASGHVDFLIFVSRSMIAKARQIKIKHPAVNVVVFTGLIPDDEIVILSKGWFSQGLLERFLL